MAFFTDLSKASDRIDHKLLITKLSWYGVISKSLTAQKMSKYGDFSGLCFPVFGIKPDIHGVNLRI